MCQLIMAVYLKLCLLILVYHVLWVDSLPSNRTHYKDRGYFINSVNFVENYTQTKSLVHYVSAFVQTSLPDPGSDYTSTGHQTTENPTSTTVDPAFVLLQDKAKPKDAFYKAISKAASNATADFVINAPKYATERNVPEVTSPHETNASESTSLHPTEDPSHTTETNDPEETSSHETDTPESTSLYPTEDLSNTSATDDPDETSSHETPHDDAPESTSLYPTEDPSHTTETNDPEVTSSHETDAPESTSLYPTDDPSDTTETNDPEETSTRKTEVPESTSLYQTEEPSDTVGSRVSDHSRIK